MGGAASKAKGSAFERYICKTLSLWVTNGVRTDCFWRSAMSGGRATVARRKGVDVRQAGDITAVSPEGHALTNLVFIECKHYADLHFDSFILQNKGLLAKFWSTAKKEANSRNKQAWLIARQNRRPTLLLVNSGGYNLEPSPLCRLWLPEDYGDTWVYLFNQVIESKPPKEFRHKSAKSKRERLKL